MKEYERPPLEENQRYYFEEKKGFLAAFERIARRIITLED